MTKLNTLVIGDESLTQHCAEYLLSNGHTISALVTDNPDILRWAQGHAVPVTHPGCDLAERLSGIAVDWVMSIANLKLLPRDVIAMGRRGAINFHDGPLPKHAGLNAPVWALIEGETTHGVTWHLIEDGVDTGDILVQREFAISDEDSALTLNTKCYEAALDSFPDLLTELSSGTPNRKPQDASLRTYHALAGRPVDNGVLQFDQPADAVLRMIRALDHGGYLNPLCTPKLRIGNAVLSVGSAKKSKTSAAPGTVIDVSEDDLTIAFAQDAIRFTGLKDLRGEPVKAIDIANPGDVIAQNTDEDHTALFIEVAKKDAFWRAQLDDATPVSLPFTSGESGKMEHFETAITPETLPQALGVLAKRLCTLPNPILAFANQSIAHQAKQSDLISAWVPFRVADNSTPQQNTSFAKDLVLRDPKLGHLAPPAIAFSVDAGPVPGAAITFEANTSTVVAHVDTGRIRSDFAAVIVRRVTWLSTQLGEGKTLEDLEFLPPEECAEVLETRNATTREWHPVATMHAAFEAQVDKTPHAVALVHEATELTFADLNEQANRIAHVLRERGVTPDTTVGLFCHRGPNLVAGALGILKAGGAYVPLDPDYPQDRLEHYLKDSGAQFVVTEHGLKDDLPENSADLLVLDQDTCLPDAGANNPTPNATGENLAYMIYTSGSTGLPKGVMIEHRNVLNFYAGMDDVVSDRDGAAWLAVTSLSFDISVLELFYTMARGIKVILPGRDLHGVVPYGTQRQSGKGVDFSVYYWGNDDGVGHDKYRLLLEGAKFADDNGFCAVWTPERHFHAFGGPYPNPSVTGAAVAGATKQIGVRAGSCVAPLHHPARIAEEWAVIDNLTNGRAGVAIASGWQPDDFVLRPENTPPENKPAMFDAIDKVRKLWRGEAVAFPRQDGKMHEVVTQPRPVSKELPIWVTTAGNPETWREAGRNGANVLTHLLGQSIEEVAEKIGIYRTALRDAGYKSDDFTVTLMLHTFIAETRDEAREIAREPMKDYLRSAAGLIKQYAWAFPAFKKPEGVKNAFELNLGDLNEEELEGILDFAFERYFNDSGLFGTVEDALKRVEQVKAIGVGEIACLIDYGIHADRVLEGLRPLAEVVRRCAPEEATDDSDYSIAAMLKRHNATHMQCTPSMAQMIMMDDTARASMRNLRHLYIGGEALRGTLVSDLNQTTDASVTNMYGPTETTIWSSTEPASVGEGTVNIGLPIANTQLYVLDDALNPVGIGEEGELWIGGDGVTRGYWNRDDVTADRFRENPYAPGRMYRTGDLVQRRADGKLNFFGRTDHQVKLRGFRIELGEIESVLLEMKGITNAVVLAREDDPEDVRLVAYVTSDGPFDTKQIRKHLAQKIPNYMVPAHFVTLDAFPVTPNKKIDRKALPKPSSEARKQPQNMAPVPVAPRHSSETLRMQVASVWSDILGVANIAEEDNFFELGGHSLLAIQAHRTLRQRLDAPKLSITDIFRFPTLGALSNHIASMAPVVAALEPARPANVARLKEPAAQDRAQTRADAMARRRAMRARRRA